MYVVSLNNSRFDDFVDRIYPAELEIRDITDADMYVSYLNLPLAIDSEGRLRTTFSDKRCCKTRPPNITCMLSIINTSMLMISFSDNFLIES
jgi:hypothetical protein